MWHATNTQAKRHAKTGGDRCDHPGLYYNFKEVIDLQYTLQLPISPSSGIIQQPNDIPTTDGRRGKVGLILV